MKTIDPSTISHFQLESGHSIAYRLLGPISEPDQNKKPRRLPLVLIHGLSAVGIVDWYPLENSLAEDRLGQQVRKSSKAP